MRMEKDKKRLKRRSAEAKALQKKQFRQQVINKKKKGTRVDAEIQEYDRSILERIIGDDIQEQVPAPGSGDVEGPVRDPGD